MLTLASGLALRFPAALLITGHRSVRPSPPYHHSQKEDIGDSDHREYHPWLSGISGEIFNDKRVFSCVSFPSVFAFQKGIWDTQISVLLGLPTVSGRFRRYLQVIVR
jgi:hypothetical protein